jgi:hypothetical protein
MRKMLFFIVIVLSSCSKEEIVTCTNDKTKFEDYFEVYDSTLLVDDISLYMNENYADEYQDDCENNKICVFENGLMKACRGYVIQGPQTVFGVPAQSILFWDSKSYVIY